MLRRDAIHKEEWGQPSTIERRNYNEKKKNSGRGKKGMDNRGGKTFLGRVENFRREFESKKSAIKKREEKLTKGQGRAARGCYGKKRKKAEPKITKG